MKEKSPCSQKGTPAGFLFWAGVRCSVGLCLAEVAGADIATLAVILNHDIIAVVLQNDHAVALLEVSDDVARGAEVRRGTHIERSRGHVPDNSLLRFLRGFRGSPGLSLSGHIDIKQVAEGHSPAGIRAGRNADGFGITVAV